MTMARCAVGQGGLPHARMHDSGFDGVAACGLVVDSKVLLVFPCNQTTLAQNTCVVHGVTRSSLTARRQTSAAPGSLARQGPSRQRCSCKSLPRQRQPGCILTPQGGWLGAAYGRLHGSGPGRFEGGEALGLRALLRFLQARFGTLSCLPLWLSWPLVAALIQLMFVHLATCLSTCVVVQALPT